MPGFLPGESLGQRSLVGYSSWGHKESETLKQLSMCCYCYYYHYCHCCDNHCVTIITNIFIIASINGSTITIIATLLLWFLFWLQSVLSLLVFPLLWLLLLWLLLLCHDFVKAEAACLPNLLQERQPPRVQAEVWTLGREPDWPDSAEPAIRAPGLQRYSVQLRPALRGALWEPTAGGCQGLGRSPPTHLHLGVSLPGMGPQSSPNSILQARI